MAQHTRTGVRRYEHRAEWWREQLATAATASEQLDLAARWLHALASRAGQAERDRAFTRAAQEIATICVELERQIAPGPTWTDQL